MNGAGGWTHLLRRSVSVVVCALTLAVPLRAHGLENVAVPITLQAKLLAKVAGYDRKFALKVVTGTVRVAILTKDGDSDSARDAAQMREALKSITEIASFPHVESLITFKDAPDLAARCRRDRFGILYVTSGMRSDIESIRVALTGVDILTVSAVPEYVAAGIIVGFESVAGNAKLLVQLKQAQKQNVDFGAKFLTIATVIQ